MKYKNAAKILPEELITKLQEYVQGEYLYIPIKERENHSNMTDYALEVQKRDVHFGNFLFEGEQFCGYIDFDLSQRNIRIFDLCYFLLGLLCEEETLKVTKEKWFQVLKQVFRGYMEVNELFPQELQAVPM